MENNLIKAVRELTRQLGRVDELDDSELLKELLGGEVELSGYDEAIARNGGQEAINLIARHVRYNNFLNKQLNFAMREVDHTKDTLKEIGHDLISTKAAIHTQNQILDQLEKHVLQYQQIKSRLDEEIDKLSPGTGILLKQYFHAIENSPLNTELNRRKSP